MDPELAAWLQITRRLPRVRGAGALGFQVKRLYKRKARQPLTADVLGFRMRLDPNENVDSELFVLSAPLRAQGDRLP